MTMQRSFKLAGPLALLAGTVILGILILLPVLLLVGAAEVSAAMLGAMPWLFAGVVGASLALFGLPALLSLKRAKPGICLLYTSPSPRD